MASAASASDAATSAAAAAASFDSFDDRYLGAKASAPTTDNDGNALLEGAIYWNTTSSGLFIWNGSAWSSAVFDTNDALFSVNNLSDVADAAAARTNLGLGNVDNTADSAKNVASAASLTTPRTISLSGDVSGSVVFDGSTNVSITATVADDSHNHVISNIDGLQTALNSKASIAYVDTAVANLVDAAPTALNTLNELAAALGDDANFATTVSAQIGTKLDATANAVSASKWQTARTITLGGDLSGSVSLDGSSNVTLTAQVADDSHNHVISNIDGLQVALDGKASASHTHSSTQIADFAEAVQDLIGADVVAGAGISVSYNDTTGDTTISNTAPDQVVSLAGSGATSVSGTYPNFTISSTDTNTTYLAGNGISLIGTIFSVSAGGGLSQTTTGLQHADTSAQASVNNSGATVIQDVTLDTYGHVTGLGSVTLTASGVGAVPASGGDFTGAVTVPQITNTGTSRWQVSATDAAVQRSDARDDDTNFARLHWYGQSDTGATSNFRHAWYDGASYVNVTTNSGGRIDFTGSAASMYIGSDRVFDDGYHPNADTLTTARTINGTSFNGSANITTANWGTARTLTIGSTGKSINGSGNVSWSRAEIEVPRTLTTTSIGIETDESCVSYVGGISLFGQTDGALYSHVYSPSWKHQIFGDYRTGQIALRGRNNGTWQSWRTVLDSQNYSSYAPSLTGSGASGTWGINITGSAATSSQVTVNYNNDSNANYQMLWGSGNSVYGTAGIYCNPSTDYLYAGSMQTSNWFRSTGDTGWYSQTYAGGIYMTDTTWVRTYGNKGLWAGAFPGTTTSGDSTSQLMVENSGGTGDSNVSGVAYHCYGHYGVKQHLRADGYFGIGGWSASPWRWYLYAPTGDMTAAGNVTAYSDVRLKENVRPLESSLDKVLQLNGVRFTWKDLPDIVGSPGKADFGVLAHEVEAVAPEVLSQSPHTSPDGDPYKTVAYDKLVPLLIEAIKEQQKQIDDLKARLEV